MDWVVPAIVLATVLAVIALVSAEISNWNAARLKVQFECPSGMYPVWTIPNNDGKAICVQGVPAK